MVEKKTTKKHRSNTSQNSRDTRYDNLLQNPLINHERGKDEIVTSINGINTCTCMWSSVTHVQILPNSSCNHNSER